MSALMEVTQADGIRAVTAEMRRLMPNACGDWADKIDALVAEGEELRPLTAAEHGELSGYIHGKDYRDNTVEAVAYRAKRFADLKRRHEARLAHSEPRPVAGEGLYDFLETVSAPTDWDGSWAMACSSIWAKWSLAATHSPAPTEAGFRAMSDWDRRDEPVMLLVDYRGDGDHPLEDANFAITVGHNNDHNVGEAEGTGWHFAGWCWSHDHYNEGRGKPVGWMPLPHILARAYAAFEESSTQGGAEG